MGTEQDEKIDELVLVVHGVGDPQPGETLSLFARSVAESQHPLTETQEILWLKDEEAQEQADDRDVKTFSTHVRHLEFGGNRAVLAEVYWGDMSRVSRGTLGIIYGLVEIVFGLRYIAFVASHQACKAAKALQTMGLMSSRILHGPVLAVNFVLAAMMLTVVGTEILWSGSSNNYAWTNTLVMGCVFICLISSFLGWRLSRNNVVHRFWFWVMISALFLDGLMLVNFATNTQFPLLRYCRVLVVLLGAQWITLVVVLISMFVCWIIAVMNRQTYRPALNVALIVPAIAVAFWGQALPMLWLMGSKAINNASPIAHQVKSRLQVPAADDAVAASPGGGPLDKMAVDDVRKSNLVPEQFDSLFDDAVPLLGIQFMMAMFVGALLVWQLARYVRWSETMTVDDFQEGHRAPRLIVHDTVQLMAGKCTLLGVILVLYLAWQELNGLSYKDSWIGSLLFEANKYAVAALVPIGGLLILSMHYLRSGLDIILDVINHFYFRSATEQERSESAGDDDDIVDVTFYGGQLCFSRRDAIHRRMKRILDYYRHTLKGNPSLTIVSHSQGSMVAIEVLNDDELSWISQKFSSVNLITMGTPLHNLYQKYFRHFYPSLDDPFWHNFRRRVQRWLNIFRIDDYVGTDVELPPNLRQVQRGDYSNHAVERRGHQLYWCDRQVLSIIREHDICRSLSAEGSYGTKHAA